VDGIVGGERKRAALEKNAERSYHGRPDSTLIGESAGSLQLGSRVGVRGCGTTWLARSPDRRGRR